MLEKLAKSEMKRLKKLLTSKGVTKERVELLNPIIENTAWMKVKLDEAREVVKDSTVVIPYDNGGGQKGLRENPIYKGYEALFKSYMSGMVIILNTLPPDVVKEEIEKATEKKTTLELVRSKHKKEA